MEKSQSVDFWETEAHPDPRRQAVRDRRTLHPRHFVLFGCLLVLFWLGHSSGLDSAWDLAENAARPGASVNSATSKCRQAPVLYPGENGNQELTRMFDYLSTPAFENGSIARLSGAVRVRTESFDDLGNIGEDKRWDVFYKFHEYLAATFPQTHAELKVDKVNTFGLLYTWEGSDKDLKPTLLMAHQDTVPVPEATLDQWTHPPFDGVYDGEYIWGRGASDCKNNLIAMLETVELLVQAGFKPKRTVLMSLGFDEECSGTQGAGHLAPEILDRYGEDGVAVIVDEGHGWEENFGRGFALPGVAEKGAIDIDIAVRMPGGHSSVPPDHTSIGVLSEIITAIEAYQYPTYLDDENPYLGYLTCSAEYAPEFPKKLKKLLAKRGSSKKTCMSKHKDLLALEAAKLGRYEQYLMQTSQAVDLIQGGVKVNALPETARATVNHRINIGDEPDTVRTHITAIAKPIAAKYNLTLHAFDGKTEAASAISLSNRSHTIAVAPITPTDASATTPWSVLAGSIRALYGEDVVVAPGMMTGNTDTRYYWDLSRHIFRFGPGIIRDTIPGLGNIHTVDEKVSVYNHIHTVKWFTLFLRNMDAADL